LAGRPKVASGRPANATPVDVSKASTVSGRVLLDGPAPANAQIKMSADPFCNRANEGGATFESFVVDNGGLGNVFVYIKDGLGNYWVDVPESRGS
jgi:hypothetical protein